MKQITEGMMGAWRSPFWMIALSLMLLVAACSGTASTVGGSDESGEVAVSGSADGGADAAADAPGSDRGDETTSADTTIELAEGLTSPTIGLPTQSERSAAEAQWGIDFEFTIRTAGAALVNSEMCLTGVDDVDDLRYLDRSELLDLLDSQDRFDGGVAVARPYMPGMGDIDERVDAKDHGHWGPSKWKRGHDPEAFDGPMYRPHLLLGPPGFEPPPRLAALVQLLQVDLSSLTPPDVGGDGLPVVSVGEPIDPEFRSGGPLASPDVYGDELGRAALVDAVDLNDIVTLWVIGSAEHPALLDPAVISQLFPETGLEPVYLLIPNGGHMYGPEGPAMEGQELRRFAPHDFEGTVAIIDTSFGVEPVKGDAQSVAGHGSFIAGIAKEMLPDAKVATVDLGPAGQNVRVAIRRALRHLGIDVGPARANLADFDVDMLSLLVTLKFLGPPDIFDNGTRELDDLRGINMSFGSYTCDGFGSRSSQPPVGLAEAIAAIDPAVQIFSAAGNDGDPDPWWPAALAPGDPRLYSVGAHGSDGVLADFSNFGLWVEHCEMGVAVDARPWFEGERWSEQRYQWSGTSFASPQAMARHLGRVERLEARSALSPGEALNPRHDSIELGPLGQCVEAS